MLFRSSISNTKRHGPISPFGLGRSSESPDIEALDVPTIRGYNRRLTRELARWIYTQIDEEGHPLYSGIRYISKHGDYECWALFDGTEVEEVSSLSVECRDNDLLHVARMFNLTVH